MTAHEHGTTEFKDRGEDYSVFNGQRAGPDRGGERIRDVVGTDAKGGEEGEETAANDDPFESLGFSSAGQKVAGRLSERIRRAHRCA